MPLVIPVVSAESRSFVEVLTAVISSLLGRNFFSAVLEDFEADGSLGFDVVTLGNTPPSFDSVVCSVCGGSFCTAVALDDIVGRTGTTGLIAVLDVTLR